MYSSEKWEIGILVVTTQQRTSEVLNKCNRPWNI